MKNMTISNLIQDGIQFNGWSNGNKCDTESGLKKQRIEINERHNVQCRDRHNYAPGYLAALETAFGWPGRI
jgi:hypothetical protein